jgi:AbrB family looped-hinge helix DNA binding protein
MSAVLDAKVTAKGQVTIPLDVRQALGIEDGDRVEFFVHRDGRVFLRRRDGAPESIFGLGQSYAKPSSEAERVRDVARAIASRGSPRKAGRRA